MFFLVQCSRVHHISRAAWLGALIDLYQTSAESPVIFLLLQELFRAQPIASVKQQAIEACNFTRQEWTSFLVYTATFYDNLGNYYSYGMKKFIPEVEAAKVECLINASAAASGRASGRVSGSVSGSAAAAKPAAKSSTTKSTASSLQSLWNKAKGLIYYLGPRHRHEGFGPDGINTYFSSNCNATDAKIVKNFLVSQGVEAWNSRVIKTFNVQTGQPHYEIRFASSSATGQGVVVDGIRLGVAVQFQGNNFVFTRGELSLEYFLQFFFIIYFNFFFYLSVLLI